MITLLLFKKKNINKQILKCVSLWFPEQIGKCVHIPFFKTYLHF